MRESEAERSWSAARLGVGLGLLLLYTVPLFLPPPARPLLPLGPDATLLSRIFPNVPAWWMVGRLIALLMGALLIASLAARPVFRLLPSPAPDTGSEVRPWTQMAALLAAVTHVACLWWLAVLPLVGQALFVIWLAVPGALIAAGTRPRMMSVRPARREGRSTAWAVAAIIVFWVVCRVWVSWHSPRAADGVDMWRMFGGLVRIAATKANFLTAPIDPELPGLTGIQFFFHGLPLLEAAALTPSLTWVQVANAATLAACAVAIAALCGEVVGPLGAPIATAAFLFSPFVLLFQLYPLPPVWLLLAALLALLLVKFYRRGSPAALAFLGGVAGFSASYPSLVPMTGLALVVIVYRLWRGPRIPPVVVMIALLSFVAIFGASVPGRETLRMITETYVAPHWPWNVAEPAMQGQVSPTIADWFSGEQPRWYLIPIGTLMLPFAIARNALRLCADVVFEPVSAGLSAVGLVVCARSALRDRMSLLMLAFVGAALAPGLISSYDRPSPIRVLGAPIPLALLAAAGYSRIRSVLPNAAARPTTAVVAIVIAASGTVIFDLVNPRILAASSLGLLVRSVDEADLRRVAVLTVEGEPVEEGVDARNKHREFDWLRLHHPYTDEIVRCVPKRPIAIVPIDGAAAAADAFDLFFWSPALQDLAGVRDTVCRIWPDSAVYTITDAAGLRRLYGARPKGPGWTPAVPTMQWTVARCP